MRSTKKPQFGVLFAVVEARDNHVAPLEQTQPASVHDIGHDGGTLAARRGDCARSLHIAEKLRRIETPYLYGTHTFRSACIIALLGDKDRAVALLPDAVAQGSGTEDEPDAYGYGFIYRHSMDLESLRGYPPFEELIKPKD